MFEMRLEVQDGSHDAAYEDIGLMPTSLTV
jgi:hypothetical protein